MSNMTTTNAQVASGSIDNPWADLYFQLLAEYSHNELCDAYGLNRDGVDNGTHWTTVVSQAVAHGDIDPETMELT